MAEKREPGFISPMKCLLKKHLPSGNEWSYEPKLDGYRIIAVKNSSGIHLYSRNEKDWTPKLYRIRQSLSRLRSVENFVFDGEIVALDEHGRPSFQRLQNLSDSTQVIYYIFDILWDGASNVMGLPQSKRKIRLQKILKNAASPLAFLDAVRANPSAAVRHARRLGLEGLIAKDATSTYEPGTRSGRWVKIKFHQEQEFVIGGFTPPRGSRRYFGSILVGYYEPGVKDLKLASAVGTGFDDHMLSDLHSKMLALQRYSCPFDLAAIRSRKPSRWGRLDLKRATWIQPKLVCHVKFTEWTEDGNLRHPVFLGLREDVEPRKVVREVAR
jgi:bifunctional non-homologous end joining protein LigD